MELDRKQVTAMVTHQMKNQSSEKGLITDYATRIQPLVDKMNVDEETKSVFIEILMQSMNATAQLSVQVTADVIEAIHNQEIQKY